MSLSYDLDIVRIKEKLKDSNYKNILLQFPDGFKYYSNKIVNDLQISFSDKNFFIYFGSSFGACDLPLNIENIDLIIHWGHTKFLKTEKW